jgi:hypothetical protein
VEYHSYVRTLVVSCDEYSSLVIRHAGCHVACNMPLDGIPCPCILFDPAGVSTEKNCAYAGVTSYHASTPVLMERNWCRDRRQERSMRYSDSTNLSDLPVSVIFTD